MIGQRPKKRIHVVGAVFVDQQGRVLAAKRGPDMSLPDYWEFPGGKINPGESPRQALHRELQEELLCDSYIGTHIVTTEFEYDFAIVRLETYYCDLRKGHPQATEHAEIRWVPAEELDALEWAPADLPTVTKLTNKRLYDD